MSRVALFYFSGTGNTAAVANIFTKEFESCNWQVVPFAIDRFLINNSNFTPSDYDIIGLGYPVHAFNAPKLVFDFIDRLPDGNGKRAFIFKCPGDPLCKAGSTHLVRRALQKRNFNLFHESLIVGHANVVLHFDNRLVRQLYLAAKRKIKFRVQEIIQGTSRLQSNGLFLRTVTTLFSAGETQGAKHFGKNMKISEACTKCLKCTRICPEQNIATIDNSIIFKDRCAFCMRCIYACPVGAIIPGFGKFIKVKHWDTFEKIGTDESTGSEYVTSKTYGYFAHYRKYFNED